MVRGCESRKYVAISAARLRSLLSTQTRVPDTLRTGCAKQDARRRSESPILLILVRCFAHDSSDEYLICRPVPWRSRPHCPQRALSVICPRLGTPSLSRDGMRILRLSLPTREDEVGSGCKAQGRTPSVRNGESLRAILRRRRDGSSRQFDRPPFLDPGPGALDARAVEAGVSRCFRAPRRRCFHRFSRNSTQGPCCTARRPVDVRSAL